MKSLQKPPGKKTSNIFLPLFPYVFLLILSGILAVNYYVEQKIAGRTLPVKVHSAPLYSYPMFQYSYEPYITAKAAIVMDDATKRIMYTKNPTLRLSTASTAKIMTTLVAVEHFKEDDELTIMRDTYEGTVVGFPVGEKVRFGDLLYAMLLPSGNDAAYTIAENYPGGIEAFVASMNEKAKQFRLDNTHFADPAGLEDDGSFATVIDLARLCSEAMKSHLFARIVSTKEKVFTTNTGRTYDIVNINRLLGTNGVIGIKTGQTMGAGEVLTTAKVENGRRFIIVVMQSSDRFGDTQSLLNLISNNIISYTPQVPEPLP
ncbi:MAG: D-alanyl-D-alanine carboxypeptidase [Candidatus Levybacteria bacterium]|nr:D-alanyl-D-alanine carboxypeptidase [Candidatus Levybacteria bacterium]